MLISPQIWLLFGLLIIFLPNVQLSIFPSCFTLSYYPCKYHLFKIVISCRATISNIFYIACERESVWVVVAEVVGSDCREDLIFLCSSGKRGSEQC